MRKNYVFILGFILVFVFSANGQISLLKDINTSTSTSGGSPNEMTQFGNYFYFSSTDGVHGTELWKSDGTTAGTTLFKDIYPGSNSSIYSPSAFFFLTVIGNVMYFKADNGENGSELWRTDGTAEGTYMLKDINPGSTGSNIDYMTNCNGILYFRANDGTHGMELWKSDGTANGTVMVQDINTTPDISANSNPSEIIWVTGTTVYFVADDGQFGTEIWKTDGTITSRITDINPSAGSSNPLYLAKLGSTTKVAFKATNNLSDYELWTTNGVGATKIEINATGSSNPSYLTAVGDYIYFSADNGAGSGNELWRTDGTSANIVFNLNAIGGSNPRNFTLIGTTLYFSATYDEDATNGIEDTELFKLDNATNSSLSGYTIINIEQSYGVSGDPYMLTNINGTLYMVANKSNTGFELNYYSGTGTTTSTIDVRSGIPSSNPGSPYLFNGTVVFQADDQSGAELWKATLNNTTFSLVKDFISGTSASSPSNYTYAGNADDAYFVANNGSAMTRLIKTSGSVTNVVSTACGAPGYLTMVGNTLFFQATDGTNGNELWKTDGTTTTMIDINKTSPSASSSPANLIAFNSTTLIFTANDGSGIGTELWKYDLSANGGVGAYSLVKDINMTAGVGSNPYGFRLLNGILYFGANDGQGSELWRTDGTSGGTYLVENINTTSATAGSGPNGFVTLNNKIYFVANDGNNGTELWRSDGIKTSLGGVTEIVHNIAGGSVGSNPANLRVMGSNLFFTANDGANGNELWKTDGTTATLIDINKTLGVSSDPGNLTVFNNKLYFSAKDANGTELWVSDGSVSGTSLFKDINPGPLSSSPSNLTIYGNSIYFIASDGTGNNVFVTDGIRSCATNMVPPYASAATAGAASLTLGGSKLYFSMIAQGYDREPFVLDPSLVPSVASSAITTHPTTQTKTTGTQVDFTVAATGTNLTYQWQKNGSNIASATSPTYTISSVTGNDAGAYKCIVTGTCGTLTSNEATLTVFAPEPTAQPTGLLFSGITNSSFTVSYTAASGSPAGYLVIRKVDSSPTGVPADATTYAAGATLGDGVVAYVGTNISFNETLPMANYYYDVYTYNGSGTTINYFTTSPLEGSITYDSDGPVITDATPATIVSGTSLTIAATVTETRSKISTVSVDYKSVVSSGSVTTKTMTLNSVSGKYEYTIQATEIGELGVEYKITATNDQAYSSNVTGKTTITLDPTIPYTAFGNNVANYRIISVPLNLTSKSVTDVFNELGAYDKTKWRMFRYEGGSTNELTGTSPIELGKGYWLIVKDNNAIRSGTGTTPAVSSTAPFTIDLVSGWNQIGNPYPFNVLWQDVNTASGASLALKTYGANGFVEGTKLNAFEGGFVFSNGPVTLKFPVVKNPLAGRVQELARSKNLNSIDQPSWEVNFTLNNGEVTNEFGGIGMNPQAADGYDEQDDFTLPRFLDYLELSHTKNFLNNAYTKDVVATKENHVWEFTVESNLGGITELKWDNSYFGNNSKNLILYDLATQASIDMKTNNRYSFEVAAGRKFKVLYGETAFVNENIAQKELVITRVYPNPAESAVIIGFTLPNTSTNNQTLVKITTLLGQPVTNVFEGGLTPGYHEITWNGLDTQGQHPVQGLYLVEVKTAQSTKIEKLVIK